jgi:hypothetical protein
MKHQTNHALYAYWQSRRRSGGVSAGDICAAELAPILPALFLIDILPFGNPRYRFCGGGIAALYGRDVTDESFLALWNAHDRLALRRAFADFETDSAGLVAGVMAETTGGGFVAYEMLLLPLAGPHAAAGAIGSMVRTGGHADSNRRRARIVAQWLRSFRFLPEIERFAPPAQGPAAEMSGAPGTLRRYRHLTVVTGGR